MVRPVEKKREESLPLILLPNTLYYSHCPSGQCRKKIETGSSNIIGFRVQLRQITGRTICLFFLKKNYDFKLAAYFNLLAV